MLPSRCPWPHHGPAAPMCWSRSAACRSWPTLLADDFELGGPCVARAYAIACAPMLIDHVFPETSMGEVFHHELRWARTVRLVQPAGYMGSIIIHFVPLALLGAALTGFRRTGPAADGRDRSSSGSCRRWCSVRMARADDSLLWLLPARGYLLALGVFLAACWSATGCNRGVHPGPARGRPRRRDRRDVTARPGVGAQATPRSIPTAAPRNGGDRLVGRPWSASSSRRR